jgi:outer membrane immunogenic protein
MRLGNQTEERTMRKLNHTSIAFIAILALTANANAADLEPYEQGSLKDGPVISGGFIWTGLYVGAHGGYAFGDSSSRDGGTDFNNPTQNPPHGAFSCAGPEIGYCGVPVEIGPEGGLVGGQIGYNFQRGNLVLGAEGELGWLNASENGIVDRPNEQDPTDQDILSVEYSWYGTLALRAGYAADNALFYAKGGLAIAEIETFAADVDPGGIYAGSVIDTSDVETGWALGGGIEYAITPRVSLKAEYLYMDFGSSNAVSPDGDIYKTDHALHTAKLGVNFLLSDR